MSRRPTEEETFYQDAQEGEFEDAEEGVSGVGEGDEVMQEAQGEEEYSSSTPTSTLTWISWFCSLPGHEYFCEVTEDFIEDDFNLTGLNAMVPFWREAMEMVLDVEPDEETNKIPDVSIVEASAELLYGLVHQRFILTRAGLQAMVDKYENNVFGSCPRFFCKGTNIVPCGKSDLPGYDTVKLYCPNCNDIYTPPSSRFQGVDGAFFGTTFPHLFFQSYRELAPAPFYKPSLQASPRSSEEEEAESSTFTNPNPHGGQKKPEGEVYRPKIYGFRVSELAKNGPRMQWMRLRPQDAAELDMVDWRGRFYEDEEEYDDDDEQHDDPDRPMEDFDPDDHGDGDEDEEEEEEEEEEDGGKRGHGHGRVRGHDIPHHSPTMSPPSSAPPRTPRDALSPVHTSPTAQKLAANTGARVKVTRQWVPSRAAAH